MSNLEATGSVTEDAPADLAEFDRLVEKIRGLVSDEVRFMGASTPRTRAAVFALRQAWEQMREIGGSSCSQPPRSCIEFRLSIGAEGRDELVRALRHQADTIEREQNGPRGLWGGAGSHGDYTFDEDASIAPEDYRRDLEVWCERKRKSSGAGREQEQ